MTEAHRQARFEWSHAYENGQQNNGEEYFFQMKVLSHNFNKVIKERLGPIVSLKGSVTSQLHVKIINDYVVPTLYEYFPHGNGIFKRITLHHTIQKLPQLLVKMPKSKQLIGLHKVPISTQLRIFGLS
ncbi:unnamed protein product [Rhizophagus irregularis]|nr:unnamed protein product [Rhizophagus irregularis]